MSMNANEPGSPDAREVGGGVVVRQQRVPKFSADDFDALLAAVNAEIVRLSSAGNNLSRSSQPSRGYGIERQASSKAPASPSAKRPSAAEKRPRTGIEA
jgi:hypothetical protein